jgi:uncharacterized membrane protein
MSFGDALSDNITPWLHILAVAVWVGPQFMMFIAAVPAIRTIEDQQTRARVMRTIVTRFGWMAWAAMAVIVLSGISNLFQVGEDAPFDLWSSDYKWFHLFSMKMVLVGFMVALTAVHTFIVGPKQLALNESPNADPAELSRLRRASIMISGVSLLFAIVVILVAMIVADHEYSFQEN